MPPTTHNPSPKPTNPSPRPPSSTQLHPPPTSTKFTPLFTLLTTHPSSTTHHPKTHYLFSDDDPSLLTSAALSTLEPASPTSPSSPQTPPATARTKEHILLIDLDASGTKVVNAQSMSAEWAITDAEIGAAPTWGEEREEGLMLRIEGVEGGVGVVGDGTGGDSGERKEVGVEEMEGLVERFRKEMEGLRRVVEAGERWGGEERGDGGGAG